MTLPTLSKPFARLLIAFLVICLAGCKEDFALLDDSGNIVGKGTFKTSANFPSPARLTFDGKEYTGLWDVEKIYEEGLAESRRLVSERAYIAYEVGNDPKQLKHGHASFSASDGSKIQCNFYFRIQPDVGICDMDGKQLTLTVEQW